ncbi:hypothetical protein ES703_33435 [subsurface metagenome]
MNYDLIDIKLKTLIKVCKETGNYQKLAALSFVLVGNLLDEIGVKLGIRPRDKDANEAIFQYMTLVNSILHDNFKMVLFQEDVIESVKTTELLFSKHRGDIPMEFISETYKLYYDLRKLEIPNLFEKLDVEVIAQNSEMRAYSFLSGVQSPTKKKNSDQKLKQVIIHGFKEQEIEMQKELNEGYDKEKFEKMITLKNAKAALRQHESGKIVLRGRLKDNIIYQRSIPHIFGYLMVGLFVLFFVLGLAVAIQTIYHPKLTASMSIFSLTFFGTGFFFIILYRQYFKKGGIA